MCACLCLCLSVCVCVYRYLCVSVSVSVRVHHGGNTCCNLVLEASHSSFCSLPCILQARFAVVQDGNKKQLLECELGVWWGHMIMSAKCYTPPSINLSVENNQTLPLLHCLPVCQSDYNNNNNSRIAMIHLSVSFSLSCLSLSLPHPLSLSSKPCSSKSLL